jgi:hypothetical protein
MRSNKEKEKDTTVSRTKNGGREIESCRHLGIRETFLLLTNFNNVEEKYK